jgi:hypothetical protein
LLSNFPSADDLRYLVTELGYRGDAAIAALSRAHEPWTKVSDRRKGVTHKNSSFSPEHPYRPESPTQRTTKGGGLKKEKVTEAIAKHRWDDRHSTAVFEVVYMQRKPFLVAASLGLRLTTLYQYSSRVRTDLRVEHPQKERQKKTGSHLENSNSFVFSECV